MGDFVLERMETVMGAFAAVVLPIDRRPSSSLRAQEIADLACGTRNASAADGTLRFEIQFPGNLTAIVRRLEGAGIALGLRAHVSVPVRSVAAVDLKTDPAAVPHRLEEGAEVWDVAFPRGHYVDDARVVGDHVEASIVPSTDGMHQIYDALLTLGLIAQDFPTLPALRGF